MTSTSDRSLGFADTNVLVYTFDPSQGEKHLIAAGICRELLEQDCLCLSTQVLQELYVTLTRKARVPVESALSVLDDLSQWPVFTVDYRAIRDAIVTARDFRLYFWDSLLAAAANRLGATALLTEDLNHGQIIAGVEVRNPFKAS
jgi:predicted nucleic acid-binding protein